MQTISNKKDLWQYWAVLVFVLSACTLSSRCLPVTTYVVLKGCNCETQRKELRHELQQTKLIKKYMECSSSELTIITLNKLGVANPNISNALFIDFHVLKYYQSPHRQYGLSLNESVVLLFELTEVSSHRAVP